jgi:hypothetical protein
MLPPVGSKAQHSRRYKNVPELLRIMREGSGQTQRALGQKLDKPHSWIFNSETGNRRVDVAEFIDWCEACGGDLASAIEQIRTGKIRR